MRRATCSWLTAATTVSDVCQPFLSGIKANQASRSGVWPSKGGNLPRNVCPQSNPLPPFPPLQAATRRRHVACCRESRLTCAPARFLVSETRTTARILRFTPPFGANPASQPGVGPVHLSPRQPPQSATISAGLYLPASKSLSGPDQIALPMRSATFMSAIPTTAVRYQITAVGQRRRQPGVQSNKPFWLRLPTRTRGSDP